MTDNHFDMVLVWDHLGSSVRVKPFGQAQVLDPATNVPVTVVQNGQSTSVVTADGTGRASFVAQQGLLKLVSGGLVQLVTSPEAATQGAANAAAAQAAQALAEKAAADAKTNSTAATNSAIDAHLGGDATSLVPAVAGKVPKAGNSVVIGDLAMANMTAYNYTYAIGYSALQNGTKSRENIGIGNSALLNVSAGTHLYDPNDMSGSRNTAIGGASLMFLTSGYNNVAIGRNAGSCQVSGSGLVALGANAMAGNAPIGLSGQIENWAPFGTAGSQVRTVAVGGATLNASTALNTVAVGGDALRLSKKSDYNVAVGVHALYALDTNTGYLGGVMTTTSVTGTYTQSGTVLTMKITGHGVVVGDIAYIRLLDGASQTAGTDQARAYVQTVPDANTFTVTHPISQTGSGTAGFYGKESAAQQGTNDNNVAIGYNAADELLTGTNNVAVGTNALGVATTATQSVVIGRDSFGAASSATNCVGLGFFAANNMTGAASQVTALGASALRYAVDGTNLTGTWNNITGVGADTRVSAANQVALGNTLATVYAQAAIQTRSDARDKADVQDTALGLDFIEKLRPVDYRWDRREDYAPLDPETGEVVHLERDGSQKRSRFHHGLIAQEVAEVIAETGVDFGGFQDHKVAGGSDVLSIGYEELIAPLIKAVQELSAEVKALKAERA